MIPCLSQPNNAEKHRGPQSFKVAHVDVVHFFEGIILTEERAFGAAFSLDELIADNIQVDPDRLTGFRKAFIIGLNLFARLCVEKFQVSLGELSVFFRSLVRPGDCILLCSDGLTNMLADQELLFEVIHGVHKEDCCRRLIGIAKDQGAPDNVTAVLIAC